MAELLKQVTGVSSFFRSVHIRENILHSILVRKKVVWGIAGISTLPRPPPPIKSKTMKETAAGKLRDRNQKVRSNKSGEYKYKKEQYKSTQLISYYVNIRKETHRHPGNFNHKDLRPVVAHERYNIFKKIYRRQIAIIIITSSSLEI